MTTHSEYVRWKKDFLERVEERKQQRAQLREHEANRFRPTLQERVQQEENNRREYVERMLQEVSHRMRRMRKRNAPQKVNWGRDGF